MKVDSPDPKLLAAALKASQTSDLGRFVEACAEGLGELLAPETVHAYLRAPTGTEVELRASWPAGRRGVRRPPALLSGKLIKQAQGGGGVVEDPAGLRPGGVPWPGGEPGDVLLLPIGEGPAASGVFLVIGSRGRTGSLGGADLAKARAFLAAVAPALDNVRLIGDLRETALRDDIAECYNRRHFDNFLSEEIARARRFRSNTSILFFDMDNLKSVNSAHGHAMGSRCLQEVATRVVGVIRKIDKLFRFGGDEFCVVLPETNCKGAVEVGSRIRVAIAGSPFLVPEVGGFALTASLGAATFPEHGTTSEALIRAADVAMQKVKLSGKNAIGTAEPPPAAAGEGTARGGGEGAEDAR